MALDKAQLAHALRVQQDQVGKAGSKLGEINRSIASLNANQQSDMAVLEAAIARAGAAVKAKQGGATGQGFDLSAGIPAAHPPQRRVEQVAELDVFAFSEESDSC